MSIIDVQNAKQIRDPMQVLITMEVPDESTTLSFSGYSSAKVADGVLNHQDWPMRKIADLQGDGFVLDGTVALYDPTITASQTNGKLGVRGNVGEPVSVTVTGSATIDGLTVFASGAESVTYNGTTSAMTSGQAIIPVGASSITLTFNPSSQTERVLVTYIMAGTALRITNESIIRCVVSLRSDLSIIDPTLPESELNVEVYNDADISEQVANLPEDTPITYQAGYEGDMSPLRKFYVSGQVTWADNVLSIHAVDAVHFLDWEMKTPLQTNYGADALYGTLDRFLSESGVSASAESARSAINNDSYDSNNPWMTAPNLDVRSFFAETSNLFHQELPGGGAIWIRYVDAGLPKLSISKPIPSQTINEEDCVDVSRSPEVSTPGIRVDHLSLQRIDAGNGALGVSAGSAEWVKDVGVSLSFSDDAHSEYYGIGVYAGPTGGEENKSKILNYYHSISTYAGIYAVVPMSKSGEDDMYMPRFRTGYSSGNYYLRKLTTGGLSQNDMSTVPWDEYYEQEASYAAFIPWDAYYDPNMFDFTSQSQAWNDMVSAGVIPAETTSFQLEIRGRGFTKVVDKFNIGDYREGTPEVAPLICGEVSAVAKNGSIKRLFPRPAFQSLLERSPVTGSFTWKGDPRMQPRDVVTFHRLDGTDEVITLENITLTHEGGGTVAEITYRKGIV